MAVTDPSRAGQLIAGVAIAVAAALIATALGAGVVLLPMSFTLGVLGLLLLTVVLLTAAILPSHLSAPGGILRGILAVVLVVSAVWPGYIAFKFGAAPGISPTRIVYWGLVLLWLFWLAASPTLRVHLFAQWGRFKVLHVAFAIYFLWLLVTALASENTFASIYYLVKLLLGAYIFYLIVLSVLRNADDVERLVTWIVVAAALVSLIGIAEGFRKANLFSALFPRDAEQAEALAWIVLDKTRGGAYRVASTFTHPLAMAEYLTMCLPLATYLLINGQTQWRRWTGLGALPLMLATIYLSGTRSALVAMAVGAAVMLSIAGARAAGQHRNFLKAVVGVFVIVSVLFAAAASIGVLTELTVGRDAAERGSTNARIVMFERGFKSVAAEPLLGHGPGRAAITLGLLPGLNQLTVDSYYLSVALESGFPGLLLFVFTLASPIALGLFRGLTHPTRAGWMALALATALLVYAVVCSVLSLTNNLDFSMMLVAMLVVVELHIRAERLAADTGLAAGARSVP